MIPARTFHLTLIIFVSRHSIIYPEFNETFQWSIEISKHSKNRRPLLLWQISVNSSQTLFQEYLLPFSIEFPQKWLTYVPNEHRSKAKIMATPTLVLTTKIEVFAEVSLCLITVISVSKGVLLLLHTVNSLIEIRLKYRRFLHRSAQIRDFTVFLLHTIFCALNRSALRNSKLKLKRVFY